MDTLTIPQDLVSHIDSLIGDGDHHVYDLRDPKQYAFACAMAELHGSAKTFPGRLKTLDTIKQHQTKHGLSAAQETATPTGWQNMFAIPGLGLKSTDGTIASNGFGTIVGGYSSMNLTMIIQDNTSHDMIAHGFSNDFTDTLLAVSTQPTPSVGTNVTSYLHYSYTAKKTNGPAPDAATSPLSGSSGVVKRAMTDAATADPVITAPIRTTTAPKNPKAINIGLGRGWTDQGGNSQFDYAWNEPTQNHPVGKIPFVGEVTFTSAIKAPLVPSSGIYLTIYVADQSGGGGVSLPATDMNTVYQAFSIDASNPNKLVWNLPRGVSTSNPGNPIVFSSIPWNSDMLAYFYCGINIVLENGSLAFAGVQSTDAADENPLDGILEIMPIDFIWHCIGEGALVSMADGTKQPIETVMAGDKVVTQGGPKEVLWTNKGFHKGGVVRISTGTGQDTLASDNHLFFTDAGPVQAVDLKVGDTLIDEAGGSVEITTVSYDPSYDAMMFNLATRDHQDAADFDGDIATFVVNGVVVGDINAQKAVTYRNKHDMAYVKAQVPDYLHPDVEAFFRTAKD